jgi:hypothetical protein
MPSVVAITTVPLAQNAVIADAPKNAKPMHTDAVDGSISPLVPADKAATLEIVHVPHTVAPQQAQNAATTASPKNAV